MSLSRYEHSGLLSYFSHGTLIDPINKLRCSTEWSKKLSRRYSRLSLWHRIYELEDIEDKRIKLQELLKVKYSYSLPIFPLLESKSEYVWHFSERRVSHVLVLDASKLHYLCSSGVSPASCQTFINVIYVQLYHPIFLYNKIKKI